MSHTPSLAAAKGDVPLRILLAGYRSAPFVGGQGIFMTNIARALCELGHRVDIISGPPYPDVPDHVTLIKLPSLDLYGQEHPLRFRASYLARPLDLFEYMSHNSGGFPEPYTFGIRLSRYMKQQAHNYDVLHDNQSFASGLLTIQKRDLPVVGTMHHPVTRDKRIDIKNQPSLSLKFLKWRWYHFLSMQKKTARQIPFIMTVSDNSLRDAQHEFGIPKTAMRRIHLGIHHDIFKPKPRIKREDNLLICVASADVPLKGLIYLIRALAKLKPDFPDLRLRVIGHLREGATKTEIKKRGLTNSIEFIGGVKREEIVDHYARATIAISPSLYEGFGFPAGEALSCGTPLIATNGGALPEIVGDAGVIVPAGNSEALAAAIADLLKHPAKRKAMQKPARQRILQHFTWARCGEELAALYRDALMARLEQAG